MTQAIRIHAFGGPEVLQIQPVDDTQPAADQIRVKHEAIGLNMVDTYFRSGLYPVGLPSGLGSEAAGVITAIGTGVTGFAVGDRVSYASPPPLDAYSEARVIDARWAVKLPPDIDSATGAAITLKGLTSWFLLKCSQAGRLDFALCRSRRGRPHHSAVGEATRRPSDWSSR